MVEPEQAVSYWRCGAGEEQHRAGEEGRDGERTRYQRGGETDAYPRELFVLAARAPEHRHDGERRDEQADW